MRRGNGLHLTDREVAILAAVADALVPPGGTPAQAASEVDTAQRTAEVVGRLVVRDIGWVLRLTLWAFELWTLLSHLRPFTRLPVNTQRTVTEKANHSGNPLRSNQVVLLKHVLVNAYLSDRGVARAIGERREEHLATCDERPGADTPAILSPLTWPDIPPRLRCDAVVVGSGAGGAPVAALLAEAGLDVVVLEEGGYHTPEEFRATPVFERLVGLYRDLGMTGTVGRPPIPTPVGRAVGGTTVVNAGTSYRAPDDVLARWSRDLRLEDLGPAAMRPVFDEVEKVQAVGLPPEDVLGRNAEIFRRGALPMAPDGHTLPRNHRGCRGCGESVVGCPYGAKQAVHLTWLPRAEAAGARILSRVRVDRVRHEAGRATGVDATLLDPGPQDVARGRLRIDAGIVVVAAGAFHTPVLLQRSGIDDPSGLRGRNLQLHPAIGVTADMPEQVRAWEGVLQSWGTHALMAQHGITVEVTAAPMQVTGGQMPFTGHALKALLGRADHLATCGFLIEDSTSGRVYPGPRGRALGTYQLRDADLRRIATGFAWVAEAFLEAGASRVLVGRSEQPWASTRRELEDIRTNGLPADALKLSAYHPVGTHRVGGPGAPGPADPWGRVRAVEGCWVADASLLPSCLGVNPQLTIMAMAVRTTRRILEH